jgi:hypothetical protein
MDQKTKGHGCSREAATRLAAVFYATFADLLDVLLATTETVSVAGLLIGPSLLSRSLRAPRDPTRDLTNSRQQALEQFHGGSPLPNRHRSSA